jgi:hypothetical protein
LKIKKYHIVGIAGGKPLPYLCPEKQIRFYEKDRNMDLRNESANGHANVYVHAGRLCAGIFSIFYIK